jgi:integrase
MEQQEYAALSPYQNFCYALKAKETKRQYPSRLDRLFSFLGIQGTIEEKCLKLFQLSKGIGIELLESHIIRFINSQKRRIENREISEGTLHNYIKAIKLFFAMNDIIVNWKKISKGIPQEKHTSDDRIPTLDEIRKLLEHPDRRIKPIVLTMVSSGIRSGSWDYLKWKHIIPIKKNGIIVGAQLLVKNTKINNREYITFITPEAYKSIKDWMDFRQLHGEEITGESWLMRDASQKIDRQHGHRIGLAKYPRKINSVAIRNMIYEAWKVQGIRSKLSDPERKRHEFKSSHGFRKFFETKCQISKMNHNHIKLLMDHSLAESQNYHRPAPDDLFRDYLNAVDRLRPMISLEITRIAIFIVIQVLWYCHQIPNHQSPQKVQEYPYYRQYHYFHLMRPLAYQVGH